MPRDRPICTPADVPRSLLATMNSASAFLSECNEKTPKGAPVDLTRKLWATIVNINNSVNTRIKPRTDMENYGVEEYWSYPDNGYGDCEDYALEKRRELMERGRAGRRSADDGCAPAEWRRPCRADRAHQPRRVHSRQSGNQGAVLDGHRLHLSQASIGRRIPAFG